jgi:ATP-dependent Clp protease ATP-binding subunit ClpC
LVVVFERYTEQARDVVAMAQEEARRFKHSYIGTEHVLLGLFRVDDSIPQVVLEEVGLELEDVREKVVRIVGVGDVKPVGQIPFTLRAKKIMEMSLREALSLGQNYIGPEHILLGLVRENEGVAGRILEDNEISADVVRDKIMSHLVRRAPSRPAVRAVRSRPSATRGRVPGSMLRMIADIKDEALDLGLINLAQRLRAIERDFA